MRESDSESESGSDRGRRRTARIGTATSGTVGLFLVAGRESTSRNPAKWIGNEGSEHRKTFPKSRVIP